ncbi:MAG: lipopolysaccharide biosynthesis protein [Flavobacteriales bacterium]
MSSENNKRIAKNTMMLYVRMLLKMVVSLYSSRVILNTLGVEDYGIYNVVGGVVIMFGFLNSTMSGTTSRFLSFEIGNGNSKKLKETFSSVFTIHIIIAFLVLLLAETIGLWFVNTKLVIPENRMYAANVVYHLSVLAAMISIVQVPYNALLISHEKMNVFAYIEILNTILKLGILFLLVLWGFDKLIFYGILVLSTSFIILMIYLFYCLKKFPESKYKFTWSKEILHPIFVFSGWDLYGNLSVMTRTQGVNILLNLFFGVVINTASGIATQIQGVIMSFASNILLAVKPQIVKYYAAGERKQMLHLMLNSAKLMYLLLFLVSLPLIIEMQFVLKIWLTIVPDYLVGFARLTLIFNFIASISIIVVSGIHATGKNKRPSLINGTLYLLVLPLSYFFLKNGGSPIFPYVLNVIFVFIGLILNMYTLKLHVKEFDISEFFRKVLVICFIITFISLVVPTTIYFKMDEGWLRFILVLFSSIISVLLFSYAIAIDKKLKIKIKQKLKTLLIKRV